MNAKLLLATLAMSLGACSAPTVIAGARYSTQSLDGGVSDLGAVAGANTTFDDLGLGSEEGAAGAMLDLKWGSPHLSLTTQSTSFKGSGIVQADITLDGQTFSENTPVNSQMDVGLHTLLLTFDMVPGPAEFGLGFGVTALDFLLALDSTDPLIIGNLEGEATLPIPVIGARGTFWAGPIEVAGTYSGMSVSVDEGAVQFSDIDIFGRWHFIGGDEHLGGSATIGWRKTDLDVEFQDAGDSIDLDFALGGPYIGLNLHF